jgi:preprotein translocase subunit SecA
MLKKLLNNIIGDPNAKAIQKLTPLIQQINTHEQELQKLTDSELQAKTIEFQTRIQNNETVDQLLPEAYAVVKNACRRLIGQKWQVCGNETEWNMIPYDVQLIGGIVIHQGCISEMKTGEGKTLVCTLPLYLNALAGKGAHLVTVNNYLARRDAEWMGGLFRFLGMNVGILDHGITQAERQKAYQCDITYGTNTEFGFDYLRDNMARKKEELTQRKLHYAIVDEVDSILIDEARTPLIISAPAEESTSKYSRYCQLVSHLTKDKHYELDEKAKTATLTEEGIKKMEELLGLQNIYTEAGFSEVHHIEAALKAQAVFVKDKDYVEKDGEILIVDEFTGRLMPGRRYSDGLHQALEAKEGVEVRRESKTLANITLQNYFRLYKKLAGMTGTALTEAEEFAKIYDLECLAIPTNQTVTRLDLADSVYKNENGKFTAVVNKIKELHTKGQPVLVGTITIEKSEAFSQELLRNGVPHKVLNAKHHEKEAEIISRAGERGAVTIATNMAGRGTDIKLGEGVENLGGLFIIGTERHESRRIDNQLRGRSGRQGDNGISQFFVSMEDSLMRLFGGEKMQRMMEFMKVPEDMPIENKMISHSIESAQRKVEAHHFDIRKHLVEYDDVMNKQREIIYARRRQILQHENIRKEIQQILIKEGQSIANAFTLNRKREDWDLEEIAKQLNQICEDIISTHKDELPSRDTLQCVSTDHTSTNQHISTIDISKLKEFIKQTELQDYVVKFLQEVYFLQEKNFQDQKTLRFAEHQIYLSTIDRLWMEHLENMRHLREKVSLRGFGQRDPLIEYKNEAFISFEELLGNIRNNTIRALFKLKIQEAPTPITTISQTNMMTNEDSVEGVLDESDITPVNNNIPKNITNTSPTQKSSDDITVVRVKDKPSKSVGRNDPCPCGATKSDSLPKKYKHCCGR